MKTSSRRFRAAFTLIELMAVITIIVILAALVVSGMGFVKDRQANETARVQIALLSKALEDYKLDNGTYPATSDQTGNFRAPKGTDTSEVLFEALYYDGVQNPDSQKIYVAELDPKGTKQKWTSGTPPAKTTIIDPWKNQYCYRSAFAEDGTTGNPNTQNPDFDIWSMGKDGKSSPGTPGDASNKDDIKNF